MLESRPFMLTAVRVLSPTDFNQFVFSRTRTRNAETCKPGLMHVKSSSGDTLLTDVHVRYCVSL